jgi:hypothetical protein
MEFINLKSASHLCSAVCWRPGYRQVLRTLHRSLVFACLDKKLPLLIVRANWWIDHKLAREQQKYPSIPKTYWPGTQDMYDNGRNYNECQIPPSTRFSQQCHSTTAICRAEASAIQSVYTFMTTNLKTNRKWPHGESRSKQPMQRALLAGRLWTRRKRIGMSCKGMLVKSSAKNRSPGYYNMSCSCSCSCSCNIVHQILNLALHVERFWKLGWAKADVPDARA